MNFIGRRPLPVRDYVSIGDDPQFKKISKFGESMFGKIKTIKLVPMLIFSSVLFRHTRNHQTFETWFHNLGSLYIETMESWIILFKVILIPKSPGEISITRSINQNKTIMTQKLNVKLMELIWQFQDPMPKILSLLGLFLKKVFGLA